MMLSCKVVILWAKRDDLRNILQRQSYAFLRCASATYWPAKKTQSCDAVLEAETPRFMDHMRAWAAAKKYSSTRGTVNLWVDQLVSDVARVSRFLCQLLSYDKYVYCDPLLEKTGFSSIPRIQNFDHLFSKIRCFLFNKADIAWILRTLPATLTYWIFWKDFIILGLAREYIVIIRHTPWKPITTTWLRLSRHKFLWLRFFTFQNRFSVLLLSDSSRYVFTSTHVHSGLPLSLAKSAVRAKRIVKYLLHTIFKRCTALGIVLLTRVWAELAGART